MNRVYIVMREHGEKSDGYYYESRTSIIGTRVTPQGAADLLKAAAICYHNGETPVCGEYNDYGDNRIEYHLCADLYDIFWIEELPQHYDILPEPVQTYLDEAKQKEQSEDGLEKYGVAGFDTKSYQTNETDIPTINKKWELNLCSNLIANMVKKGAPDSEIGSVIRYSMVVLDTERMHLNWAKAKMDEGIYTLLLQYMDGKDITKHWRKFCKGDACDADDEHC